MEDEAVEEIEMRLLLEALRQRYGYEFHHYAAASLRRRIGQFMSQRGIQHISQIIPQALYDREFLRGLVNSFSVPVTEMFRDPAVFVVLREKVVPILKTYPFVTIWHAGCSTGEEVYSLAIVLHEENLLERCHIFATDFNEDSLSKAKAGVFALEKMKEFTENYLKAQGRASFSDYYHAKYQFAKMRDFLNRNIIFAAHNLSTDSVFIHPQLIMCRNVLIYFDEVLQNRVLTLFCESLDRGGILCLGRHETLRFSDVEKSFQPLSAEERIFRKMLAC
ncbi:MAG: protein-glutamate O-methyltransferase CheR [Nitrospirae bacterium]|nr:protein-glutamate O-methyltransferase CheR [Magnetococcales bacterium]